MRTSLVCVEQKKNKKKTKKKEEKIVKNMANFGDDKTLLKRERKG